MYDFAKTTLDWVHLYDSRVSTPGQRHMKVCLPGTTPTNQETLNVYLEGTFEVSIPDTGFTQTLTPGQSSLDLAVALYPAGVPIVERALTTPARRICLSPVMRGDWWVRQRLDLLAGASVYLGTDMAVIATGQAEGVTSDLPVQQGGTLTAVTDLVAYRIRRAP
jgi:hypothetical protein